MNNFNFPIVKRVDSTCIGDKIIGFGPDETLEQAAQRHLLEQRKKKIDRLMNIINKKI